MWLPNFEGLSLGASLEVGHGSLTATDGSSDKAHSTRLGLQTRYDWALGNQFLLGLGASVGTGQRSAGSYLGGTGAYTKNRYAIDLMPGYAINNQLMVYGKISALSATALSDDGTNTASVHGTGYGIGVRGLMDSNTYWQAGLDTHRFQDVTFSTTSNTATGTWVRWEQVFSDASVAQAIRHIVDPANEQNLDRLSAELGL